MHSYSLVEAIEYELCLYSYCYSRIKHACSSWCESRHRCLDPPSIPAYPRSHWYKTPFIASVKYVRTFAHRWEEPLRNHYVLIPVLTHLLNHLRSLDVYTVTSYTSSEFRDFYTSSSVFKRTPSKVRAMRVRGDGKGQDKWRYSANFLLIYFRVEHRVATSHSSGQVMKTLHKLTKLFLDDV